LLLFLALQSCAGDVVRDILAKSGVTRYQASPYGEMRLGSPCCLNCVLLLCLVIKQWCGQLNRHVRATTTWLGLAIVRCALGGDEQLCIEALSL
jgi:hypothetical protein